MNIYQCQEKAKQVGFDSAVFTADFPSGKRKCRWLDAYMGMFRVEDIEGFMLIRRIDEMFPGLEVTEPTIENED